MRLRPQQFVVTANLSVSASEFTGFTGPDAAFRDVRSAGIEVIERR